jgi:hypothetical protein
MGGSEHPLVINDSDGDEVCRVWEITNGFVVKVPGSGSVKFVVDGNDEVTGIFVKLLEKVITDNSEDYAAVTGWDPTAWQEVLYKKVIGGSVVQTIGDYIKDDLEDAEELYNDVMDFFGFDYNAEGRLLPKHFTRMATGLYMKDEVAVDLYTGSIVQPDPNVQPPKTGDAASVMGFAMIALALAAMGYAVSRKVRA